MESNKHFLVGIFGDHDILLSAVTKVRESGVKIHEVFTPYPVHGLEHNLGYKRSFMPKAAFLFGLTGCTLAIIMQVSMMNIDWPMIIGGKPTLSFPDFVPVTFESTVLIAAFGMVFTFLFNANLKPHKVPRIFDRRSTDDKHVMAIDLSKNNIGEAEIKNILDSVSAEEVFRKDFTDEENKGSFRAYIMDVFKNGVTSSSRKLN